MSVEPLKMTALQQHLKRVAEHKKFKESLTPSEQMDYETFGKEYVLRGRDLADRAKRDAEMEEKRREAREEREEKVYGKELRITGEESDEEIVKKRQARAEKDDEEYKAEKEKEKKLMEERKANRMKQMEANWKVYMTVKDMIALLKENGKSGYSGKKKAELIEMIEKHGLKEEKKEEPKVEEPKAEEQPSPAQKVRDISTTGDDRPLWEKIMKMRGEMMAFDALPKRAKALEKAEEEITEDYDTKKLEKLSGDPEFVKKLLKQENYEEDFKQRYKREKRANRFRRDENQKSDDQMKTEIDEELQEEYRNNRREIARQFKRLYEEMDDMKPRSDFEKTDWFDALDTEEYDEITTRDIEDNDPETDEDSQGNEYGRVYKTYTRDVYKPKNAPFNLVYQHTTEVRTYNKDEDGNWDFSGDVEEEELIYDDDRGYYLERKY